MLMMATSSYKQGLLTSSSSPVVQQFHSSGLRAAGVGHRGMRQRPPEKAFKGAEIQNLKTARVYVFGDGDVVSANDEENVEFEMPEVRSRLKVKGSATSFLTRDEDKQPEYFLREIGNGETLQAIALKYACPVSELKRLNKLIQDQEFFGLKVLKVPIKKYGILSEEMAHENKAFIESHHSDPKFELSEEPEEELFNFEESDSQPDLSDPDTQMKIMRTLSIRDNFSPQSKDTEQFLQRMDEDLKKLKQSSRYRQESLSEVISVLTNKSIQPLQRSWSQDRPAAGNWRTIIVIAAVVAVVVPVIIFLYLKYFSQHHQV